MALNLGGLDSLGCDGMQRDILLLFDELFKLFGEEDDLEFCGPRPERPLMARFVSFVPELGAQKHGIGPLPTVFRQEMLFPWIKSPLIVWREGETIAIPRSDSGSPVDPGVSHISPEV